MTNIPQTPPEVLDVLKALQVAKENARCICCGHPLTNGASACSEHCAKKFFALVAK